MQLQSILKENFAIKFLPSGHHHLIDFSSSIEYFCKIHDKKAQLLLIAYSHIVIMFYYYKNNQNIIQNK